MNTFAENDDSFADEADEPKFEVMRFAVGKTDVRVLVKEGNVIVQIKSDKPKEESGPNT